MRVGESLNEFARAAHAPRLALRIDKRLTDARPKGTISAVDEAAASARPAAPVLDDLGIPSRSSTNMALKPQFDTRDTGARLKGSRSRCPS